MEYIEITKIEILQSGELSVTPVVNWNNSFQFIYRTATGVAWNEKSRCFTSPVPKEWSHLDWYGNIITSVLSEMEVNLKVTPKTEWLHVPESFQRAIANYAASIST